MPLAISVFFFFAILDFGALFENDAAVNVAQAGGEPAAKKARVQRTAILQFDHVAVQALNPCGESAVGTCSLEKLWELCTKGNKSVAYHSNLCSGDAFRKGIGMSHVDACLLEAFKRIRGEHYKKALKESVYNAMIAEMDVIQPHLEKLNVGARQFDKASGCSSLRSSSSSSRGVCGDTTDSG